MKVLTRDEIASLSPSERLTMIGDLWDSLDDAPLSPAQASELERRVASLDDDLAEAVTWDALKAELAARAS
ncbi:MAG: addiction module protein [Alphaproteobacteria bacterium]|nr:addiction module protein [Alphaproteobacteria bacterium]MBU1513296.1 addiction module protein [Alphaproteobacteria bacterium]MBU2093584.1 addiction module protein [Alphaproteobacteria bacterium]MBU2151972.1 addiction module protein [Alphaproteobacteria bacterium]MBU2307632.1 addiction module protein [Alphaproteobacteria bacterium]